MRKLPMWMSLVAVVASLVAAGCGGAAESPTPEPSSDETAAPTADSATPADDPNARYYTPEGRESAIAAFEEEDREDWQMTARIMDALALEPGMTVADVGAGTGYFSRHLAARVAPQGRVLAVDIIPEFLVELEQRAAAVGIDNIETVRGELDDPNLPAESVDLIFLGDAYHHFGEPEAMVQRMREALRPGGRMAIVDWERAPNPRFEESGLDWETHIRIGSEGVIDEVTANGFRLVEQPDFLDWQFFLIFERVD